MQTMEAKDGLRMVAPGTVSIPGQIYFLTAVTQDREPFFRDFCNARVAVNELRRLHECGLVRSLAWVVMPDHLHWLIGLGHTHSISVVAKMMKARTAQAINRNMNRHGQVWQRAFHEHEIGRASCRERVYSSV